MCISKCYLRYPVAKCNDIVVNLNDPTFNFSDVIVVVIRDNDVVNWDVHVVNEQDAIVNS